MNYELLVGLNVIDDEVYANYREAMAPLLLRYGGGFRYDFKIAETLKSQSEDPINRVFTIHFKDADSMKGFFTDPEYLKVKAEFFERSVKHTTIIAEYTRQR